MVEDFAALLGIGVAALGIFLSEITRDTNLDAINSIAIGVILMTFAFFLAKENKGLLVGEAISRRDHRKIADLVRRISEVNRIVTMRTMHFAPEGVLVAIEVDLRDGLDTDKLEVVIDKIEQ